MYTFNVISGINAWLSVAEENGITDRIHDATYYSFVPRLGALFTIKSHPVYASIRTLIRGFITALAHNGEYKNFFLPEFSPNIIKFYYIYLYLFHIIVKLLFSILETYTFLL